MSTPRHDSVTRRSFLKATAATSAVIAAPTIVPSTVFGADAPSNRINLGFVGIGKQSSGHLGYFLGKPGNQVVAVCDVEKSRLELAKSTTEKKYASLGRESYKGCAAYNDHRELVARKDIDAIVIGTPDHWHTAIIIDACKAGKDVYCEKPLTLTIDEAHKAIQVVRKYKRVFQTGSQQRSEHHERSNNLGKHLRGIPRFRAAAEYVRSGRLGKIKEVDVHIGRTSKPCDLPGQELTPGLDWDRWLGQAPTREWNEVLCRRGNPRSYPFNPGWRDYREYSGGHVTDWGAHHFDITQWALGMDESGPVKILPPEKKGDTQGARVIYDHPDYGKVVATHKTNGNGIRFIGERGSLWVNRGQLKSDPESILTEPLAEKDVRLYANTGHRNNWIECIHSRKRPICDVEIGSRSVTVCHLVNLAYWHGRALKWDPVKWEFPGDAEANSWRSRPQREGYALSSI